jgi:hypothetical protein
VLGSLLLIASLQIGPFFEKSDESFIAVRPFYSETCGVSTDILWPLFTYHRDWWRFAYIVNYSESRMGKDGYMFSVLPFWFNGRDEKKGSFAGLFPIYGRHPHLIGMYDFEFALWPLWMSYSTPRSSEKTWMKTHSILFPFVSWRSDGSWNVWPIYGYGKKRESDHRYALWPFVTWASYKKDRDTPGEGSSWMVFPFYGNVSRERENAHFILPPFFSRSIANGRLGESYKLRCPWPFFEYEKTPVKSRISVFPFYENVSLRQYEDKQNLAGVTRYGWRLVEIYRNKDGQIEESRVFPFWVSNEKYFRFWPFWESSADKNGNFKKRFLSLIPIRWSPAIDANWAKFWTLYECDEKDGVSNHSLLWGIIRWRTGK